MIIEVTQEDIDNGLPNDGTSCPLALAIKRAIPDSHPFVGDEDIEMRDTFIGDDIPLTRKSERFIECFDAGKPVKPTRFRIPGL